MVRINRRLKSALYYGLTEHDKNSTNINKINYIKMEQRIIAFIGTFSCLILANINKEGIAAWFWVGLAICWVARLTYLKWIE